MPPALPRPRTRHGARPITMRYLTISDPHESCRGASRTHPVRPSQSDARPGSQVVRAKAASNRGPTVPLKHQASQGCHQCRPDEAYSRCCSEQCRRHERDSLSHLISLRPGAGRSHRSNINRPSPIAGTDRCDCGHVSSATRQVDAHLRHGARGARDTRLR